MIARRLTNKRRRLVQKYHLENRSIEEIVEKLRTEDGLETTGRHTVANDIAFVQAECLKIQGVRLWELQAQYIARLENIYTEAMEKYNDSNLNAGDKDNQEKERRGYLKIAIMVMKEIIKIKGVASPAVVEHIGIKAESVNVESEPEYILAEGTVLRPKNGTSKELLELVVEQKKLSGN